MKSRGKRITIFIVGTSLAAVTAVAMNRQSAVAEPVNHLGRGSKEDASVVMLRPTL